jgi:hypothetical protein
MEHRVWFRESPSEGRDDGHTLASLSSHQRTTTQEPAIAPGPRLNDHGLSPSHVDDMQFSPSSLLHGSSTLSPLLLVIGPPCPYP